MGRETWCRSTLWPNFPMDTQPRPECLRTILATTEHEALGQAWFQTFKLLSIHLYGVETLSPLQRIKLTAAILRASVTLAIEGLAPLVIRSA